MRKISLVLFVLSMFFVSCSKDNTTDPGNNNQQQGEDKDDDKDDDNDDNDDNDDDGQNTVSIVGKWTAKDIKMSGEYVYSGIKATFEGGATEQTVGNVTYEFKDEPKVVVTGGEFDAVVKVTIPFQDPIEQTLEDQVFGAAGSWVLSDDGKKVTITDAATGEKTIMDVVELTDSSLKLKGQITKKLNVDPVGEIEPTLDIEAEFTK